jgi:hypothetical protein
MRGLGVVSATAAAYFAPQSTAHKFRPCPFVLGSSSCSRKVKIHVRTLPLPTYNSCVSSPAPALYLCRSSNAAGVDLDPLQKPGRRPYGQPETLLLDRRQVIRTTFLSVLAGATVKGLAPGAANAHDPSSIPTLEEIKIGTAEWVPRNNISSSPPTSLRISQLIPASFATYASRILIKYDASVQNWWITQQEQSRLMSTDDQRSFLAKRFGSLAFSVASACEVFIEERSSGLQDENFSIAFGELLNAFQTSYTSVNVPDEDVFRHLGILFSLLPPAHIALLVLILIDYLGATYVKPISTHVFAHRYFCSKCRKSS